MPAASRCASRPARRHPRWAPRCRSSSRPSTCTSSTPRPPSGSVAEREEPARAGRFTEAGMALLFLAPSAVLFAVFFFYPFEQLVLRGLYRNNAQGTNLRYVGWQQYKDVLTGDEFRAGLLHSLQYVLYTVPAGLILGTLLAVAAHRKLRGIRIFQT